MKIAIVLNNICGVGGVERVVANLTTQIYEKYDCEIHIISLLSKSKSEVFYDVNKNIKIFHCGYENFKNLKMLRGFMEFSEQEYDYMLCCSVPISTMAFVSKIISKSSTKIIAWEHSQYDHTQSGIKKIRRIIYPHLYRVVTLSEHDGDIFRKYIKKVSVIPNFKSFVTPKISNHDNRTLISVGRLGYEKGFDMLIDAFDQIHSKVEGWKLEIYGEGKEYDFLEEKIKSFGLENKVFLKPFTTDIKEKYLDSSIFICSSRSESFSMVIVEAMECGLPCISFNCKIGPKEIISEGIDGFLVDDFNIGELSRKMELLINDFSLRIQMGRNAKIKAEKYNVSNLIHHWEKILELEKIKRGT